MVAYADTLLDALGKYSPEIQATLIRIGAPTGAARWARRLETVSLPLRAWRLRSRPPGVWHVLDGSRAYVASGLCGAPVVVTAHDIIPWLQAQGRFESGPPMGAAARWLWRRNARAMRNSAQIVCDSESTRRDLVAAFSAGSEARVISLPLRPVLGDLSAVAATSPREPGLVLHIGHNGFYKNRAQVLRVFASLDHTLATRLLMIGPQPTDGLRALADQLGINARVTWLGDADDDTVADWYRRASVMLFPSLYEGYGWPVLEAMAFGLPVVCSNAGSLGEVAGDVVPCVAPDDIDGFVARIEPLLRDPARAAAASAAGIDRASRFSSQRFAREMSAVYELAYSQRKEIMRS